MLKKRTPPATWVGGGAALPLPNPTPHLHAPLRLVSFVAGLRGAEWCV
jgi:hypothetical protein